MRPHEPQHESNSEGDRTGKLIMEEPSRLSLIFYKADTSNSTTLAIDCSQIINVF